MIGENVFEDFTLGDNGTPEKILDRLVILSKRADFKDLVVDAKMSADLIRIHLTPYIAPALLDFESPEAMDKFFSTSDLTAKSYIQAMIEQGYPARQAERAFLEYALFNHLFPNTRQKEREDVIQKMKFPKDLPHFSRYALEETSQAIPPEIDPDVVNSALRYSTIHLN